MSRFFDPKFDTLAPYTPGEQPQQGGFIKLNTNENPYPLPEAAVEAARQQAKRLNLYPDPAQRELLAQMSESFEVPAGQLVAGNGSDELLAFCFQGLCPNGAAFPDITYGFYAVFSALYGVEATLVPLRRDFSLNIRDYAVLGQTLFIANPNAPTGLALPREQIEKLVKQNPARLVVVDEAYVDFGAESCLPLVKKHENLLVVGTFSKSRAMAGARFGWAAGSPALIEDVNRLRNSFNPYSVNRMTMAAATAVLQQTAWFEEACFKIKKTRARTQVRLREMGFTCTASVANFLFVAHPRLPGGALYRALKERGILVRHFDAPRIEDYLRITVGTDKEMDALVGALEAIISEGAAQ